MLHKNIDWNKTASFLFCAGFALAFLFFFGKIVLAVTLPFLIAYGVAALLHPACVFLSGKTRIPEKVFGILLPLLFFTALGILISLGVRSGITELKKISENGNALQGVLQAAIERFEDWKRRLPLLGNLQTGDGGQTLDQSVDLFFDNLGKNIINAVTTRIPGDIAAFLSSLPSLLLFFLVTVIASFYLILDFDSVKQRLLALLPATAANKWPTLAENIKKFLRGFLRAYALILFLTFCELMAGFTILDLEYRFIPALVISVVDIFPVLGVGTILIPWGLFCLLQRDYFLGFGLLILWAIVSVIRQIIEPKIVGGTLGIPPLIALISLYVGFRLFGLLGMLLSPAAVLLFRFVWRQIDEKNTQAEAP